MPHTEAYDGPTKVDPTAYAQFISDLDCIKTVDELKQNRLIFLEYDTKLSVDIVYTKLQPLLPPDTNLVCGQSSTEPMVMAMIHKTHRKSITSVDIPGARTTGIYKLGSPKNVKPQVLYGSMINSYYNTFSRYYGTIHLSHSAPNQHYDVDTLCNVFIDYTKEDLCKLIANINLIPKEERTSLQVAMCTKTTIPAIMQLRENRKREDRGDIINHRNAKRWLCNLNSFHKWETIPVTIHDKLIASSVFMPTLSTFVSQGRLRDRLTLHIGGVRRMGKSSLADTLGFMISMQLKGVARARLQVVSQISSLSQKVIDLEPGDVIILG